MQDSTFTREAQIHYEGLTFKMGVRGDVLAFPGYGNTEDAHIMKEHLDDISRAILAQMFTPECLEEMYAETKRGEELEEIVNGPSTT
jgi:hypothetical protein